MQKTARILIVDDDPLNRVVLDNTLSEEYQISQCESAEQALTFLADNKVDLIISDIRMPGMSGYDLLERLKTNQNTYAIPVIIISASNSYNDEAKGLQMGAMDYITKPFSPLIVKARVKNHLAIKQKNDLLEKLASIDGLTEIPNRRLLDDTLSQQYLLCAEHSKPLSLLLIDIDYFKEFNEHYGYAAGDECLVKVAHALDYAIQAHQGFVARYDGVRFAVILTGHSSESALEAASHMHDAIDCLMIAHGTSPICAHLSISIGIVHIATDFGGNEMQVFKLADSALHQAHQHQERVVVINK
ncbi:diguanylate cyclase response regulator [Pseudoalteromonas citrea]|uniref:diguanylate cyclase n=2 Tax=Pseudoalteromonas TaxID=53246 RepID=A0A5S3XL82_9GAMM|nr:diguanylate cyclase [Pseudoalteromonas citrea]TMP43695.1 diguanylate cyclase response regulator [Pseudoalteromonas citrea]TMP53506.1 diguanylate cyclase response regulator [Pseudoalteromonas citrea]